MFRNNSMMKCFGLLLLTLISVGKCEELPNILDCSTGTTGSDCRSDVLKVNETTNAGTLIVKILMNSPITTVSSPERMKGQDPKEFLSISFNNNAVEKVYYVNITLIKSLDDFLDQPNAPEDGALTVFTIKIVSEKDARKALLLLYVTDINDNPPKFNELNYKYVTPKNFPVGLSITHNYEPNIFAYDEDFPYGINNKLNFILLDNLNQISKLFEVTSKLKKEEGKFPYYDLDLKLKKKLNYYKSKKHELVLRAEDSGSPSLNTSVGITIELEQEPEENLIPEFTQNKYEVEVSLDELTINDGEITFYPPIAASVIGDTDFTLLYKIEKQSSVLPKNIDLETVLHESTSAISALQLKNYENLEKKNVTVVIFIKAYLNENKNIFNQTIVVITIYPEPEITTTTESSSTEFTSPSASSESTGTSTAETSTTPLDTADTSTTSPDTIDTTTPVDTADPSRTSSETVEIADTTSTTPLDISTISSETVDTPTTPSEPIDPEFILPYYQFDVEENKLGIIKETGSLKISTSHKVLYHISSGDESKFSIDSSTAQISVIKKLDFEENQHYLLKVKVKIKEGNQRNAELYISRDETVVMIIVKDVNEAPNFVNNYLLVGLSPSVVKGHFLTNVHAEDPDTGRNGELMFHLTGLSDNFYVTTAGELFVKNFISEEKKQKLTVAVSDKGDVPLTTSQEFQLVFLANEEMFIVTVTKKESASDRSRRSLLALSNQNSQLNYGQQNPSDFYDLLSKFSKYLNAEIGVIPQELNPFSQSVELILFAKKNESIMSNEEVITILSSVEEDMTSLGVESWKSVENAKEPEHLNDNIEVVIVLSVVVIVMVFSTVGIFIYQWYRKRSAFNETQSEASCSSNRKLVHQSTDSNSDRNVNLGKSNSAYQHVAIDLNEENKLDDHNKEAKLTTVDYYAEWDKSSDHPATSSSNTIREDNSSKVDVVKNPAEPELDIPEEDYCAPSIYPELAKMPDLNFSYASIKEIGPFSPDFVDDHVILDDPTTLIQDEPLKKETPNFENYGQTPSSGNEFVSDNFIAGSLSNQFEDNDELSADDESIKDEGGYVVRTSEEDLEEPKTENKLSGRLVTFNDIAEVFTVSTEEDSKL